MSDIRQICSFFVQDLFFGVDVLQVREIVRHLDIARVPLAPPLVSGLINLRGQILTAIDLRRCLGFPERPPAQSPLGLILETEDGLFALLVDEVGNVLELSETAFEAPPEILAGSMQTTILHVCQLPARLLIVVDAERLLAEALQVVAPAASAGPRDAKDPHASGTWPNGVSDKGGMLQIPLVLGGA